MGTAFHGPGWSLSPAGALKTVAHTLLAVCPGLRAQDTWPPSAGQWLFPLSGLYSSLYLSGHQTTPPNGYGLSGHNHSSGITGGHYGSPVANPQVIRCQDEVRPSLRSPMDTAVGAWPGLRSLAEPALPRAPNSSQEGAHRRLFRKGASGQEPSQPAPSPGRTHVPRPSAPRGGLEPGIGQMHAFSASEQMKPSPKSRPRMGEWGEI